MIPTRIGNDLEVIRRFYLKNGYADFRVIGSDAHYDPTAKHGYIVTITVEEGPQYKIGSGQRRVAYRGDQQFQCCCPSCGCSVGDTYNGDLVEKIGRGR